jgi:hypothetical protein
MKIFGKYACRHPACLELAKDSALATISMLLVSVLAGTPVGVELVTRNYPPET